MKLYAAISSDIVSSTSLSEVGLKELTELIKKFLDRRNLVNSSFWGRLVHGDSIEILERFPNKAFRLAIQLKCLVKSFEPSDGVCDVKFKHYALRLAIGIGSMRTIDKGLDMMDGEAIYLSGRTLSGMGGNLQDSFRVIINNNDLANPLNVIASLVNHILNDATPRQCEILFNRLDSNTDIETAQKIGVSRPNITKTLQKIGWDGIEKAIKYFETLDFENL